MSNNEKPAAPKKPQTRRPIMYVFLGIFLACAAVFLIRDRVQGVNADTLRPIPSAYKYTVTQDVQGQTYYQDNSFFPSTPDPTNTAYIAKLTDYIAARFVYNFQANEATDLSYQYQAYATVRATFGSASTDAGLANVWSKRIPLLDAVGGVKKNTKTLSLDPTINIPYAQYRDVVGQFMNAVDTPLNNDMVVTYQVRVSGVVNGAPFQDLKTATISAPLDQQVYKLGVQFVKSDHRQIASAKSQKIQSLIARYEVPVAIVLLVLGIAYTAYGFRRQTVKTPHQRELDKIFRYHDGIIIRANEPPDLAGKEIVPVKSFSDLLNLEEEIKTPIIASNASDTTSHFFITQDDIAYVYTLGEPMPFRKSASRSTTSSHTGDGDTDNQEDTREDSDDSGNSKPQPPRRKVMG